MIRMSTHLKNKKSDNTAAFKSQMTNYTGDHDFHDLETNDVEPVNEAVDDMEVHDYDEDEYNDDDDHEDVSKKEVEEEEQVKQEPVITQDDAIKLLEEEANAQKQEEAPTFDNILTSDATSDNYSEL